MGELKGFIVAAFIVCAAFIGMMGFITDIDTNYGANLTSNMSSTNVTNMSSISKMRELIGNSSELQIRTLNATGNPELTDNRVDIIGGGYSALKLVYNSMDIMMGLVGDMGTILTRAGLPLDIFIEMLGAIIGIIIVLAMLAVLVKWDI